MVYLNSFRLPSKREEDAYFDPFYAAQQGLQSGGGKVMKNVTVSQYPFRLFYYKTMPVFEFEPVTILYGGNGSGKSTILNLIAEKLGLNRTSVYNRSEFFDDYVALCRYEGDDIPEESRIITSDDVFNYLLDIRYLNDGTENNRVELYKAYSEEKQRSRSGDVFRMKSLDDYHGLKKRLDVNRMTMSRYVRENAPEEVRERSNGESAYRYFTNEIGEGGLYLLDEPENSMAPAMQFELKQFLTDSARFFHCQLIIATHSPFLLSMKGAKVYDLDEAAPGVKHWTELENVRTYYHFFKEHEGEFESSHGLF